jgi:hypothetical protein
MYATFLIHLHRAERCLERRLRREEGQGLVEYALIAILVIVALKFLQPQISNTLNKISNSL